MELPEAMLVGKGSGPFTVGITWNWGEKKENSHSASGSLMDEILVKDTDHGCFGARLVQEIIEVVPDDVRVEVLTGLEDRARLIGSAPVNICGHWERDCGGCRDGQ